MMPSTATNQSRSLSTALFIAY